VVVSQDDLGGELAEGRAGEHSSTEPRGIRRLLRGAGYRGNYFRFFGAVSSVPGDVKAAFERCRLRRKIFSLLRSCFGSSGGFRGGF